MDVYQAMRTSGSVRDFTDEPVSDEVLYRILDNARFAPSGGNRQGWRVIVVREPRKRIAVREHYRNGMKEYVAHSRAGFVPFAPIDDERWLGPKVDLAAARAQPLPNPFIDSMHTVPVLLIIVGELGVLATMDNGLPRQSVIGGASLYPFCQNLLLAARNEGLGGVLTTVIARDEREVKQLLGIPQGFAVIATIALGHPSKQVRKLKRRPVEEFAWIDAFGGTPLTP